MGKSARKKRRGALSSARSTRGPLGWYALAGLIVVAGVVLIVVSRSPAEAPLANRDHWHAAFGVNVCGEWLPNAPEFHAAVDNPNQRAGVHSHSDGLIHIHPYVSAEAGANATVGRFLSYGGWEAGPDSFTAWDGQEHRTGDECDGTPAEVRWELNGEAQDGNISRYRPADGDVIALALLPEGEEIGLPPSVANIDNPEDVEPAPGVTVPPVGTDPEPGAPDGETGTGTDTEPTDDADTTSP